MEKTAHELLSIVGFVEPKLQAISSENITRKERPDKWSRKEVLGHLIDSACNNQQKFVRMMQQNHLDFPGYRQDDWVDLQNWRDADWQEMISLWAAYNLHLAYLIANVKQEYLSNTINVEGVGPFTLEFVMPDYVEHLKHHLLQIFPDIDLTTKFKNVYHA